MGEEQFASAKVRFIACTPEWLTTFDDHDCSPSTCTHDDWILRGVDADK